MPNISTYGYNIITNGDRGSEFCPLLTANWERHNIHDHDGVNSKKIKMSSMEKPAIDLSFEDWADIGNDYAQNVTLPAGYLFNDVVFKFVCMSGAYSGAELALRVERVSNTVAKVYCSYNDINVRMLIL